MLNVDAAWDDQLQRWKYSIPGVGWSMAERLRTSIVSSNAVLAREARLVASLVGAKLPTEFQLVVTR